MENKTNIEEKRTLKLNTKNTIFIGFAFFAILMLWQVIIIIVPYSSTT